MIKSPVSGNVCKEVFQCKDHLVSSEEFKLYLDAETELMITHPQPQENVIHKYYESEEYNSHSEKATSLFDRIYELVKIVNLNLKYSVFSNKKKEYASILDIGCGTGDFLKYCLNKGWNVSGVEPSKKARAISELKLNMHISEDLSLTSIPDKSYDVISMWHVLEHRYDIDETFIELKRILKDDGLLILALPNYKSYDAKFYKQFWAAYDVPRHLFHFSAKTIKYLSAKHKFKLFKTRGMYFDSFYVSLLSEKNRYGKINLLRAIFTGLWSNISSLFTGEASSLIYVLKKY